MKKILYLLPPSEWKNSENKFHTEKLSFSFEKPLEIAKNATEKDLKCKDKRFQEALELNANVWKTQTHFSISRYDGVMYSAIDYQNMSEKWQKYFEKHFFILSGMYGIVKPKDHIANYKLPIETKGLVNFWWNKITQTLQEMQADIIVDLLPNSYKKMIDFSSLQAEIYEIDFVEHIDEKTKKISHWVKKIKWEFVKNICENWELNIEKFFVKTHKNKKIFQIPYITHK